MAVASCNRAGPPATAPEVRFHIALPPSSRFSGLRLSPDGLRLAVAVKNQIYVRHFGALDFEAIPDTVGASDPFWSPDGAWIGFFAGGTLKKIPSAGGPAVTICPAADAQGGTWNRAGVILFASEGRTPGIFRVPASGEIPAAVVSTVGEHPSGRLRYPEFLPDGRHFLYTHVGGSLEEARGVFIGSLEGAAESRRLLPDETNAVFVGSGSASARGRSGHILFRRGGALVGQPFDADTGRLSGAVQSVAADLDASTSGAGVFSASATGVMAYSVGSRTRAFEMVWLDRAGGRVGTVGRPGPISSARISHDGRRLAFIEGDGMLGDVWVQDLPDGKATRVGAGVGTAGVAWAPDSGRVVVDSAGPPSRLSIRSLDNTRADVLLPTTGLGLKVDDWSPDGKWVVFEQDGQQKKTDIWLLPLAALDTPTPLVSSEGHDRDATISPDGRWLAYVQEGTGGSSNVFVQSLPSPRSIQALSRTGGTVPRWNRSGTEIFYQSLDDTLMAVPVDTGAAFAIGQGKALFDIGANTLQQVSSDGQRFLVLAPSAPLPLLTVVLNWRPSLTPR